MRKSRLSKYKQLKLIEFFLAETTARIASKIVKVNQKTATYYFHRLRQLIFDKTQPEAKEIFSGQIELDESYFGGKRKGKRGRGAVGKIPVFGILKRGGKVYTQIIDDIKGKTLLSIVCRKITLDSVVYTDTYPAYNALDVSGFKHFRINHREKFADKQNHINGIENFWNQAKRHLRKFNGISKANFPLYLRECQWRFNNPCPVYKVKMLKKWAKDYIF